MKPCPTAPQTPDGAERTGSRPRCAIAECTRTGRRCQSRGSTGPIGRRPRGGSSARQAARQRLFEEERPRPGRERRSAAWPRMNGRFELLARRSLMRTRVSKAFTLVEILIVVVILGILAAIV